MKSVSANAISTNTVSTNVMSTASIHSKDKKVTYEMDCYSLHTFLSVIIFLFIIAVICYCYAKNIVTLTI